MSRGRFFRRIAGLLLVLGFAVAAAAAPRWLEEDARLPAPAEQTRRGLEILRFERSITVTEEGVWRETTRHALRFDHAQGTDQAQIGVSYVEGGDRILGAEAWLLRNGRSVETIRRQKWVDVAAFDDATLYSDFRGLVARTRLAAIGDVLGAEMVVQRGNNAGQDIMVFSHESPARLQRLEVRVPREWGVQLRWLDGTGPEPRVASVGREQIWTWEIRDRPPDQPEIWGPEQPSLRAALTIVPPAGARVRGYPAFGTWADVSAWLHGIQDAQCDRTPALTAMAGKLTAGLTDPWRKIEAIARFVQDRRYIMAYRNDGLGFGYKPRKASEVLAADYGDCKDKSNLLRALLREAGFESQLVTAYIGDPESVRPAWPSPAQFNHAILMIRLPPDAAVPGAVAVPGYGPVLYFDSTARWIPAGRLPWQVQGGKGLVCDGRSTALVDFPQSTGEDEFKVVSRVELTLQPDGSVQGTVTETMHGQLAAPAREREFLRSEKERRDYWVWRLNATVRGVKVKDVSVSESADRWSQRNDVSFEAPAFGQGMGDGMKLLNLDVLTRDGVPTFAEPARQRELLARPVRMESEVSINVPEGGRPELPKARELRTEYGAYAGRYEFAEGRVVYRRHLSLNALRVPPGKYAAFRQFLIDVARAERTAVIVHLGDK